MAEVEKLYMQASIPVWRLEKNVSSVSVISAIVIIMTMCTTHAMLNTFTDELLKYLSSTLLLRKNHLPQSFYHAKTALRKMGL